MQNSEKNFQFTEITSEESATVSGGAINANFGLSGYLFIAGSGIAFGARGLTSDVLNIAFERSVSISTVASAPVTPPPNVEEG